MTTPKEQETTLLMENLDARDNRDRGADSRDPGTPHLAARARCGNWRLLRAE